MILIIFSVLCIIVIVILAVLIVKGTFKNSCTTTVCTNTFFNMGYCLKTSSITSTGEYVTNATIPIPKSTVFGALNITLYITSAITTFTNNIAINIIPLNVIVTNGVTTYSPVLTVPLTIYNNNNYTETILTGTGPTPATATASNPIKDLTNDDKAKMANYLNNIVSPAVTATSYVLTFYMYYANNAVPSALESQQMNVVVYGLV